MSEQIIFKTLKECQDYVSKMSDRLPAPAVSGIVIKLFIHNNILPKDVKEMFREFDKDDFNIDDESFLSFQKIFYENLKYTIADIFDKKKAAEINNLVSLKEFEEKKELYNNL